MGAVGLEVQTFLGGSADLAGFSEGKGSGKEGGRAVCGGVSALTIPTQRGFE